MKNLVLVRRYTEGLIGSMRNEEEFSVLHDQLTEFSESIASQKDLSQVLESRFIPLSKKKDILGQILRKARFTEKTNRFLQLLLENDRLAILPEVLESMPEAWNDQRGVATFEVSSVVPLTEQQMQKLQSRLERLEKRPVFLTYRIDSDLVGGLSIRRKNIIYDVSIKGQIQRIKEKISEG